MNETKHRFLFSYMAQTPSGGMSFGRCWLDTPNNPPTFEDVQAAEDSVKETLQTQKVIAIAISPLGGP